MANEEPEQALAIFEHAAEELRFFKGQQWHIANYALIAYAALVAAPRLAGSCVLSGVAVVLVLVIVVAALALLWSLETALAKERGRLCTVREDHLSLVKRIHDGDRRVYRSAFSRWLARVTPEAPRDSFADDAFMWLSAAVALGAFLAIILIIAAPPPRVGG